MLTLSSKVPADKGSVHILQQDDALLWCYAQEVIEPVIREAVVTEAQQADTVLQFPGQGSAGKDTNHKGESQWESLQSRKNQISPPSSKGEGRGVFFQQGSHLRGGREPLFSLPMPWAYGHCAKQGHKGLATLTCHGASSANTYNMHHTQGTAHSCIPNPSSSTPSHPRLLWPRAGSWQYSHEAAFPTARRAIQQVASSVGDP